MKNKIKQIIRFLLYLPFKVLLYIAKLYSKLLKIVDPNGSERFWEELTQKHIDSRVNSDLKYKNKDDYNSDKVKIIKDLKFYTPNKISSHRVYTILSKEKETIKWIEENGDNDTSFFDIGANIALYSIIYSKLFNSNSYCFEPNFLNNNLIRKNIKINSLQEFVTIIPNPLFKNKKFGFFSQNSDLAGMAEGTFKDRENLGYRTLSFALDDFIEVFKLVPNSCLLKIDVDGNETDIIKGAEKFLKNFCKSALIEIRDSSKKETNEKMSELGFQKKKEVKRQSTSDEFWFKEN